MRINAEFSRRVVLNRDEQQWRASPAAGVERIMLDRIGEEVARATSLVRYAAGSSFERHEHAEGEEFLVLDGVFSDESGDYPAGTYVRNPPGSGHAPFSEKGCRIFVKLRQFDPDDVTHVVQDMLATSDTSAATELYQFKSEVVSTRGLLAGDHWDIQVSTGGCEILVVEGTITVDGSLLPAESWLRFPAGDSISLVAHTSCLLWTKTGHLPG